MKLPELKIGKLTAKFPIIQGGMAVRISTANLAAAVAREGGIGLIAASGMDANELREEIKKARALSKGNGIIGINIMVAARLFMDLVRTAIAEKIDLIVAGAGFSRDIFAVGKEANVPIVPIVSSAKLAKISENLGATAVVVEGKEAGGHLGTEHSIKEILPKVREAVKIPVVGAGGIMSGRDIVDIMKLGADGVQMGTRFAASKESNAADELKEFYLKAKHEDIVLINSPVGLPGRTLMNEFAKKVIDDTVERPESCDACLKKCKQNFCIIKALVRAQQGDIKNGLVFTGEYMHKVKEILSVKEIFKRLTEEIEMLDDCLPVKA